MIINKFMGPTMHTAHPKSRASLAGITFCLSLVLPTLFQMLFPAYAEDKKLPREEARFDIFVAGKQIGEEKYSIASSGETITSNSVINFRDPEGRRKKVQMETQLSMDSHYLPQTYQLRTNVDGLKGTVNGTFTSGEANFEYIGSGNPKKRGLLVGDRFIVLDTNVFHHFIFLVRSFDFSKGRSQSIEVVIPQELDNGVLKVSEVGIERLTIGGKKLDLHHLRADSGILSIDLWVDDRPVLYKIALPTKKIEVIRNP
jgi:hypothetical protein